MLIHRAGSSVGLGIDSSTTLAAFPPARHVRRICVAIWPVSGILLVGSSPARHYCAARTALPMGAVRTVVSPSARIDFALAGAALPPPSHRDWMCMTVRHLGSFFLATLCCKGRTRGAKYFAGCSAQQFRLSDRLCVRFEGRMQEV